MKLNPKLELDPNIKPDIYSLIAGRLVWDPYFVTSLMEHPDQALRDTLLRVNYEYTEPEIDSLKNTLDDYINKCGFQNILGDCRLYLKGVPMAI
jgi:hypothetical protein